MNEKKPAKRGRPAFAEPRKIRFFARLTEAEDATIREAASKEGYASHVDWVIDRIVELADRVKRR